MLEIIIDNTTVDLSPDIQISITMENPMMTEDRIPTPFSLSFEIPATPKNLKLFGYPNRLGTYKQDHAGYTKKLTVLRFNGLNVLQGHMQLTKFDVNLQVHFIGIDYLDFVGKKLYQLNFGRQYFEGAYSDVNYDQTSNFSHSYIQWANQLAAGARQDLIAAPVVIKNKNEPLTKFISKQDEHIDGYYNISFDQSDFKHPYVAQDVEYINNFVPENNSFVLSMHPADSTFNIVKKSVAGIFPTFRIGYILDVLFGAVLKNNPFRTGDLYHLVLPTYFFPQWNLRHFNYARGTDNITNVHYPPMVSNPRPDVNSPYPSQPYIDISDFLPDYDCATFFKNLLNLFSMTATVYQGGLKINSHKDIMLSTRVKSWNNKLMGNINVTFQKGKKVKIGYENEKEKVNNIYQEIEFDSVQDIIDHPYTLVDNREELFLKTPTAKYFRTVYVETINTPYTSPNDKINDVRKSYQIVDSGFDYDLNQDDAEAYSIMSSFKPLPLVHANYFKYIKNGITGPEEQKVMGQWIVPFINIADRFTRPTDIYISFFQHVLSNAGFNYPLLNSTAEFSNTNLLSFDGYNGLYEKYHHEFAEWIEKDKIKLSATFLLSHLDLHNLDITEKVHVDGRNFFIEKLQFTLFHDHISPVLADLIEA